MEDLKQEILNMVLQKLDIKLNQMKNPEANLKIEQTDKQLESSQNRELPHDDCKHDEMQKNTNAIDIKDENKENKDDLEKNQETGAINNKGVKDKNNKGAEEDKANPNSQQKGEHQETNKKLLEFNLLRKKLDEKETKCLNQEFKISQFIVQRQQLQDDFKCQHELHLREIYRYRKELDKMDDLCYKLEKRVAEMRENSEFIQMQQELRGTLETQEEILNDLQNQEQLYLQEISQLRKDLEAKDNVCHRLEQEVFAVRENPEFIHMREQLLEDLKGQEERHLQATEEFRQQQAAKDQIISQKEQEAQQLQERISSGASCPICMEGFNTENHRMSALACGHLFGESCVRECLERNSLCPECRVSASANDIRRLFPRS